MLVNFCLYKRAGTSGGVAWVRVGVGDAPGRGAGKEAICDYDRDSSLCAVGTLGPGTSPCFW